MSKGKSKGNKETKRPTGRPRSAPPKAGFTKAVRKYSCGGKLK